MGPTTAKILGKIAGVILRIYPRFYRTTSIGWEKIEEKRREKIPLVFVLWHGELLPPILHHRTEGIVTMASRSKDGEIITAMLDTIDYRVARGSTGKGGRRALDEMAEIMTAESRDAALTVDGPRGPARIVQPGAIWLAQTTGGWIVPVGSASRRGKRFRSWDRFLIPIPFDRVFVVHGEPFPLDAKWSEEEACRIVAESIECMSREAAGMAGTA